MEKVNAILTWGGFLFDLFERAFIFFDENMAEECEVRVGGFAENGMDMTVGEKKLKGDDMFITATPNLSPHSSPQSLLSTGSNQPSHWHLNHSFVNNCFNIINIYFTFIWFFGRSISFMSSFGF